MSLRAAMRHFEQDRNHAIRQLSRFIQIPSISGDARHSEDRRRAAHWLVRVLRESGLRNIRVFGPRHSPVIYADWLRNSSAPTLLIYGHYDVQPAGQVSEWILPPFSGCVRGDSIFGRGASDNKGQWFCHVAAIRALLKSGGSLPLNVKLLVDGEEERGSPFLVRFVERWRQQLRCDAALISDTRMLGPNRPVITYGLRGGLGVKLTLTGPSRDLHNGHFGGAIHNPAVALSTIISGLHDRNGRISIPGFYNEVRTPSRAASERARRAGLSDRAILSGTGVRKGYGEHGFTAYERIALRPALVIQSLHAGQTGAGAHSIIPASASAELRFRLVPAQTPDVVEQQVKSHLARVMPSTVRYSHHTFFRSQPIVFDLNHPAFEAASGACAEAFGNKPVLLQSGGSIPIVSAIREHLGAPVVLMGFALASDNAHGPNERFALERFDRGVRASLSFMAELGRQRGDGIRPWWGRREKASLSFSHQQGRGRQLVRS